MAGYLVAERSSISARFLPCDATAQYQATEQSVSGVDVPTEKEIENQKNSAFQKEASMKPVMISAFLEIKSSTESLSFMLINPLGWYQF